MNSKLRQGSDRLSLNLTDSQFDALETYMQCVLDFNKTYNLMKADSADELAVSHLLDSLVAVPHISKLLSSLDPSVNEDRKFHIADVGSGGGCPGIPLSVAFPEVNFTLVERMEKRADFLKSTIKKMQLKNVKVLCAQADSVTKASMDLAVFRAFHPFDPKITKLLIGMIKKGGYLVAYKARSEKIEAEMSAVSMMIPSYEKIPLTVPFLEDHERNLVVVRK